MASNEPLDRKGFAALLADVKMPIRPRRFSNDIRDGRDIKLESLLAFLSLSWRPKSHD